jgi:hypothetical protein
VVTLLVFHFLPRIDITASRSLLFVKRNTLPANYVGLVRCLEFFVYVIYLVRRRH